MTRGPLPNMALADALPIAKQRGAVLEFKREVAVADFEIVYAGRIAIVRVKRTRRLHCSISEIEHEFSEAILLIKSLPPAAYLCRELWLWSEYGTWRFFRIEGAGLVEIDRTGSELAQPRGGSGMTMVPVPVKNTE